MNDSPYVRMMGTAGVDCDELNAIAAAALNIDPGKLIGSILIGICVADDGTRLPVLTSNAPSKAELKMMLARCLTGILLQDCADELKPDDDSWPLVICGNPTIFGAPLGETCPCTRPSGHESGCQHQPGKAAAG